MRILPEQNRSQGPPDDRPVGYRADIQGLRAIAVLAVVANHLAGWPTGSFVGVDVFFVISGYLITGILMREFETRQTISFRGFYARRIKRILPAGLFVIGATVCATRVLAGIDRYHFAAADAIAAVLVLRQLAFRSHRRQLLQPVAAAVTPAALLVAVGRGAVLLRVAVADAGPAADRSAPAVLAPRARASGRGRRDRRDLRHLARLGLR